MLITKLPKKDSCHSWIVLAACFVCLSICIGLPLSFGVLLPALTHQFGEEHGKAEIAAVGAIAYSCLNLFAPISSILMRKFGCRAVVIAGGLFSGVGLSLCFLANNLLCFFLFYGVMSGVGFGLIFAPCLSNLPSYFEKYKYFAVSFASVGSAVGTLVLPQLLYFLIETYTWRGAMLLCGGLGLQAIVCGSLMFGKAPAVKQSQQASRIFNDSALLTDLRFYLLCLDAAFGGGSTYTIFSFGGSYSRSRGLSYYQAAWLISTIGITNIFSRIAASFLSQIQSLDRPLFFSSLTLVASLASYCILACRNFSQFVLAFLLYGLAYGGRISQMASLLLDNFGVNRLASAMGYYLLAGGVGTLLLSVVSAELNDAFGSSAPILWAASVHLLDALICFSVAVMNRRRLSETSSGL